MHKFKWAVIVAIAFTWKFSAFACSCDGPAPACAYISTAPVVFVGTPVYSNDDGSGTFTQQTLYKFTIDEIFKGLPEGTKEVWVDPGSFTSCYAEYKIGTKLLVFASEGKFIPVDTAAMTVAKPAGKQKPLPPGFDPTEHVYYAPECTGTRNAAAAAEDIAWLRSWKKGNTQTRIQGLVVDGLDWPLSGVKVTAKGRAGNIEATTDSTGVFSIEPVEPGDYDLNATLASYDLPWKPKVAVLERSCGYAKLSMSTAGALSGTVTDESGRPLAGVELDLARMRGSEETFPSIHHETTKAGGVFRYEDLPGGDYLIGVNLDSQPNVDTPYARAYAPGVSDRAQAQVFHLAPGQKLSHIRLQLAPRLRLRTVHVQVRWPDGRSAGSDALVDSEADFQETKVDGSASVQCFAATDCTVRAGKWLTESGGGATPRCATSLPTHVKLGNAPVSLVLILTETKSSCGE